MRQWRRRQAEAEAEAETDGGETDDELTISLQLTWDLVYPLESALHVDDSDLKVSNINGQHIPNPSLAFSSACETADEIVHIASTMLFAGF